MSTDSGSWMKRRVKKVSQVCIQRTISGFSALRVHTPSAVSTAGPSRKVNQKLMERKEEMKTRLPSEVERKRLCSMGR